MDDQHTPETAINFVCYLTCYIVSLLVSWFILCIGIIIISNIYLCYLHYLDFIYLTLNYHHFSFV